MSCPLAEFPSSEFPGSGFRVEGVGGGWRGESSWMVVIDGQAGKERIGDPVD